ncbi:hypothetical protein M2277_000846 [Paenibacillus sp. LBL]|uniref:hypothetical protein n=1 Tax=Paenibacillus sp. LBL TaxID=2940563 RepID=UPI002476D56F|nr:hypothetical protein [Paenibacillus sp. LBL]MDH6670202.1 hypothetical protein [Paenibacillus sp. LBL]
MLTAEKVNRFSTETYQNYPGIDVINIKYQGDDNSFTKSMTLAEAKEFARELQEVIDEF